MTKTITSALCVFQWRHKTEAPAQNAHVVHETGLFKIWIQHDQHEKHPTHLLVGEHEQDGLAQFVLVEHTVKLVPCGVDAVSVVRVHHEDQPLSVLVVVPPQRSDLVLPSDVPNCGQPSGTGTGYCLGLAYFEAAQICEVSVEVVAVDSVTKSPGCS